MTSKKLSLIAGLSYLIIFFSAIFANFFVIEGILKTSFEVIQENHFMVRLGIIAFLITAVFDIIVAWALFALFKSHYLSRLSTYFRIAHAVIMAVALFNLPQTLKSSNFEDVQQVVNNFNNLWLIGLFFFGFHLILLSCIIKQPKFIAIFLFLAGIMYITDTCAHFLMENYQNYSSIFLTLVAIPSIIGEMSFTFWLLRRGFNTK
ncbi:DUF4386 domain-containing protein [Aestuariibaculum sp. TT11]|uniref:DUF4386 domain-containing protein n=1 Tax=Aestuariibaculum sediminum TaxID=2770637 RepID=A0A8J6Q7V9_9FLAO|nr:DUF4386 domain-containing protein [Aestuariibaculum sediminum]